MDRQELIRQLMATFLEELENYITSFGAVLLRVEGGQISPLDALPDLFRTAHSLKGASRAIGIEPLEQISHSLEDLLSQVRNGARDFDDTLLQVLFSWLQGLELAGADLETSGQILPTTLDSLLVLLDGTLKDETPAEKQQPAEPTRGLLSAGRSPTGTGSEIHTDLIATDPGGFGGRSLRVSAQRLDELLDRADELRATTGGLTTRFSEMTRVKRELKDWQEDWGAVEVWLAQQRDGRGPVGDGGPADPRLLRTLSHVSDRLRRLVDAVSGLERRFATESKRLERAALLNAESVHDLRMIPFSEACKGLERAVRNLAKKQEKSVNITIGGANVAVDRSIIAHLKDPLLHLVRNAVDHGIELPSEREDRGKPAEASLRVSAQLKGAEVQILVQDDGRGIDTRKISDRLEELGRPVPTDNTELMSCIFEAGFSTASAVSTVSGRGVGLDVVQKQLEAIHGNVGIESQPGEGAKFILKTPLTTTTLPIVFVEVEGQPVGIVATNVRRLFRIHRKELVETEGQTYLLLAQEQPVPLFFLAESMGYSASVREGEHILVMLLSVGAQLVAFVVDRFLDHAEALVRSLGKRLAGLALLAGGTLRGDGSIAIVLNAAEVAKIALGKKRDLKLGEKDDAHSAIMTHLLVVDDSPTVRTLVGSILEGQGFRVSLAVDGQAAWDLLLKGGVDLIVSDVDMPIMTGIELVTKVRSSNRFENLPFILVTGRHREEDRTRGLEAGANAYIVKSAFDQTELLEVIERFA